MPLTPKAQQTRQRIFDVAIEQFVQKGYEETTMRDIAAAADCSLGLAYRYFDSKEALVLLLWEQLAFDFVERISQLDDGNLTERYYRAMQQKIDQLQPYREVIQATFSAAMKPTSGVAIVSTETTWYRDTVLEAFETLVAESSDAPRELTGKEIAMLMYGVHLLIILAWIYDRTPQQKLTQDILSYMRDTMRLTRPVLAFPPLANALVRLSQIAESIFIVEKAE